MFKNLRGVRKLMIATLVTDTDEALEYDTPVAFAGVRAIEGESEESTSTEYYDNQAAITVTAEGADTYSLTTSVLEDAVKAKIEGRKHDEAKGIYFGTPANKPYVAIGFIGEDTDGKEWLYWIYKNKITGGAEKHNTKDDGTETTNLEWEAASIYTQHKFTSADNKPLKFIKVKASETITEEKFFEKVYDPDAVAAARETKK